MKRKLVFYSDQVIPENAKVDRRLLSLIGKPHPVMGYIPSSSDPGRVWFSQAQAYYDTFSVRLAVYFELDVDYQPQKLDQLLSCDAIHLSGGNTFHFLYWLRARGMLAALRDYVANGGVLVGVSAGSILMTPEIGTSSLCDDVALPGEEMEDLRALGLVDFAFLPHTNHLEAPLDLLTDYSRWHSCTIYGCSDADGIVVEDELVECIGNIQKAVNGVLM